MKRVCLGLDVGTTTIAAVAADEAGESLRAVEVANDAHVAGQANGRAEQEPARLLERSLECLCRVAEGFRAEAIGLTGQMHGVVLLDRERRPLTRLISWQDRRALDPAPDGGGFLDAYVGRAGEAAFEGTGCRLAAGYGAATLYALRRTGELPPQTRGVAVAADWIGAELRGGPVATDRSNAASLGVYDLARDRWSGELIAAGELDPAWFPPVRESGEPLGPLGSAAAERVGAPPGLPVCNALGDHQAAVFDGSGESADFVHVNIGTGAQISVPIPEFRRVEGLETRYMPFGRLLLVGAGLPGGDAYAWLQRTVARWLAAFGCSTDSETIYRRLAAAAAAAPEDAGGLRCRPLFQGSRAAPAARGEFAGVDSENFTPGGVARAVVEGVVEGLAGYREAARAAGAPEPRRLAGAGNGLRKNPLMREALERRFGLPVELAPTAQEAARGAARVAWKRLRSG